MNIQEPQEQQKIIFGLTPKSTIINSIALNFISALFWSLYFASQIPSGTDLTKIDAQTNS